MPNPLEQTAAKGKGAFKAAGARLKGLTGVFNTLVEQHGEVSALLQRASKTSDADKQRDLWTKLRRELLSHERAEVSEVFPRLAQHPELQDIMPQHDADAEKLEAAIERVDAATYGTVEWSKRLAQLEDLVTDHVAEEEQAWFPRAADVVDKQVAKELDDRYKAKQEMVKEQL